MSNNTDIKMTDTHTHTPLITISSPSRTHMHHKRFLPLNPSTHTDSLSLQLSHHTLVSLTHPYITTPLYHKVGKSLSYPSLTNHTPSCLSTYLLFLLPLPPLTPKPYQFIHLAFISSSPTVEHAHIQVTDISKDNSFLTLSFMEN